MLTCKLHKRYMRKHFKAVTFYTSVLDTAVRCTTIINFNLSSKLSETCRVDISFSRLSSYSCHSCSFLPFRGYINNSQSRYTTHCSYSTELPYVTTEKVWQTQSIALRCNWWDTANWSVNMCQEKGRRWRQNKEEERQREQGRNKKNKRQKRTSGDAQITL